MAASRALFKPVTPGSHGADPAAPSSSHSHHHGRDHHSHCDHSPPAEPFSAPTLNAPFSSSSSLEGGHGSPYIPSTTPVATLGGVTTPSTDSRKRLPPLWRGSEAHASSREDSHNSFSSFSSRTADSVASSASPMDLRSFSVSSAMAPSPQPDLSPSPHPQESWSAPAGSTSQPPYGTPSPSGSDWQTPPSTWSGVHGVKYAPEERRRSWSGSYASRSRGTPDSHSISLFADLDGAVRRTRSSLGFEGTPSKLGRGPMVGRVVSMLNTVRFRGRDTGRLAVLIALNIAYSTTEFVFGLFTGKIELVSDSFHLSFGCCVLILSLTAMVWGRQKHDAHFTYGYGRLEVLAAFTNALFLLFLSFSLSVEALHAFIEDESEHRHYLVLSAVANLLVNLLGVYFFRSYARVHMQYNRPQDMNHHAIFLHLLSDSIRSAGVILASWFLAMGVHSAEAICLGLVAATVLFVTLPILRSSGGLLLQMAPAGISEDALHKCIREAASYEGVVECYEVRFWAMVPGVIVGTLNMRVASSADEQRILQHVHSVFNDIGITDLTIQLEQQ